MLHHDQPELQFAPLFNHFEVMQLPEQEKDNCLANYMYMYHDEKNHYWYKHSGSRKYVVINEHGTRQKGQLDTSQW